MLLFILFVFKPLKIKEQKFVDVPLLEMSKFTMYELNKVGLQTSMAGSNALRYADRYEVKEINFRDNSKKFISKMKADFGVYKNDIVDLKGNITFLREDGLKMQSKTLHYNIKNSIAQTDDAYILNMQKSQMRGSSIVYDTLHRKLYSKDITMTYNLKEEK